MAVNLTSPTFVYGGANASPQFLLNSEQKAALDDMKPSLLATKTTALAGAFVIWQDGTIFLAMLSLTNRFLAIFLRTVVSLWTSPFCLLLPIYPIPPPHQNPLLVPPYRTPPLLPFLLLLFPMSFELALSFHELLDPLLIHSLNHNDTIMTLTPLTFLSP